ncbi:hypothetical protein HAX54_000808, partial [Datura stramonium]|nr:hypothetical protein [Datura stramonium]
LAPYESLHAWIDGMEAQVNERLKDLMVPDLAKFASELAKAQANILWLQQEMPAHVFSILVFEELKEEEPFITYWENSLMSQASAHEKMIRIIKNHQGGSIKKENMRERTCLKLNDSRENKRT